MPSIRETHIKPHLSDDALKKLFKTTTTLDHRDRWQLLWLVQHMNIPATYASEFVGYANNWGHYWIRIYNEEGPSGITKIRLRNPEMAEGKVTAEMATELASVLKQDFPLEYGGGIWSGPKVCLYFKKKYEIDIHRNTGWCLIRKAGMTFQSCRPVHADSTPEKKKSSRK